MSEREIIDYGLVEAIDPVLLANAVRGIVLKGWQPFGSVVAFGNVLVQPIVKYREPEALRMTR